MQSPKISVGVLSAYKWGLGACSYYKDEKYISDISVRDRHGHCVYWIPERQENLIIKFFFSISLYKIIF